MASVHLMPFLRLRVQLLRSNVGIGRLGVDAYINEWYSYQFYLVSLGLTHDVSQNFGAVWIFDLYASQYMYFEIKILWIYIHTYLSRKVNFISQIWRYKPLYKIHFYLVWIFKKKYFLDYSPILMTI